jgi:AcrR family transcriptional regulator
MKTTRKLLSQDEWVEEALNALASAGIAGLSVESLARRLGVSKGSFYWHFLDLPAFVRVVLKAFEVRAFADVVKHLATLETPRQRFLALIQMAWRNRVELRAEAALSSAALAGHPEIARSMRRIAKARLAFLVALYRELGCSEAEAQHWSTTAYACLVGTQQLMALSTGILKTDKLIHSHVRHLERALLPLHLQESKTLHATAQ